MSDANTASASETPRTALLGWSVEAMEALDKAGMPFLAVVPPIFEEYMKEHGIAYELWDFERINDHSHELGERLLERGVEVAVPLYEETVEWAGAINGRIREDPRCFNRALLFRDKAMMKRKAQMNGIRVGVFEEVDTREQVSRFLKRVNKALLKIEHEEDVDPVHLKPLSAAGCVGHRVIRSEEDVAKIEDEEFPCLVESNLAGQEFSCEAFVHDGKLRFLNITEYVHLGHSNFIPASANLEAKRPLIEKAVEHLIRAFDVRYGMIHPEYFITQDGTINFGEVAARVPGGHIFELIGRAHGFDPFVGFALCSNPNTTEKELEEFFPDPSSPERYAGCLMVYPRVKVVEELNVPDALLDEPEFVRHNLFVPVSRKVQERAGFGDHYGTIFFEGDDPERMHELLTHYEHVDFYR